MSGVCYCQCLLVLAGPASVLLTPHQHQLRFSSCKAAGLCPSTYITQWLGCWNQTCWQPSSCWDLKPQPVWYVGGASTTNTVLLTPHQHTLGGM